jgi:exosortase C (VPDSG-CTERM-specific)
MTPNPIDASGAAPTVAAKSTGHAPGAAPRIGRRFGAFAAAACVLALLFGRSLIGLARLSASDDLYSYIPLIPLVSGWLVWTNRRSLRTDSRPDWLAALLAAGVAGALVAFARHADLSRTMPDVASHLALMTAAFLGFFAAAAFVLLGGTTVRSVGFPLAFLIFIIPLPGPVRVGVETMLQYASAAVAHVFFWTATTPVVQQRLVFFLPSFSIEVAPECSGIHSTLMLLITAVLAGYLFLREPGRRLLLAAAVLPLALLRNGLRIFIVGELCVHVGPEMIDSYIHRKGGPIFFALSLVPFLILLRFLQKSDPHSTP